MMGKEGTRSNGTKQDPISWMNGLSHPVTGELLQGARWSPVTGCTADYPCWARCWARIQATTRMAHLGEHYQRFTPTFHHDRLGQPLRWRKPRAVFTCGMGDLFHEQITNEQIAAIFGVMAACMDHLFIILTKRVKRADAFIGGYWQWWDGWGNRYATDKKVRAAIFRRPKSKTPPGKPLPNVWLLASVSNQEDYDNRIRIFEQTPAALHGISVEPMLGPVDLRLDETVLFGTDDPNIVEGGTRADILRWCIAGGETQPGARPCDPAWVRDLRDQCVRAGTPFHFKGWGTGGELRGRELDGRTWEQVP